MPAHSSSGKQYGRHRLGHLVGRDLAVRTALAAQAEASRGRLRELSRHLRDLDGRGRMVGREHRPPGRGERQAPGVELREQPQRVDVERRRLDESLEAVGGNLVAGVDVEPGFGVASGHGEDRPDDLAEHRPEIPRRVLRVVDLRAQASLADGEAAGERVGRHPDVDPEPADLGRPVVLREVVADEVAGDAEVAPDRLPDPPAVERPRERVGDGIRDRAVVLVAGVERRDEVEAALEDRARTGARPTPARSSGGPSRPRRGRGPRARPRSRRSCAAPRPCRRSRSPPDTSGSGAPGGSWAAPAGSARRSRAAPSRRRRAASHRVNRRPHSRAAAAGRGSTGPGRPAQRARRGRWSPRSCSWGCRP